MKYLLIATFAVSYVPKIINIKSCMSELYQDPVMTFLEHIVYAGIKHKTINYLDYPNSLLPD